MYMNTKAKQTKTNNIRTSNITYTHIQTHTVDADIYRHIQQTQAHVHTLKCTIALKK